MATASERATNARIAANERWAKEPDRSSATAKARANSPASIEYWMKKVDPEQRLTLPQRLDRAKNAKAAFYQRRAAVMRKAKALKAAGGPA